MEAQHSPYKIELEADILVVIIHSKFHKNPFITFSVTLITNKPTHRHTQGKTSLTPFREVKSSDCMPLHGTG